MAEQKIYVFLATGFEEVEAITIIDVLRRAKLETVTVSVTGDRLVTGAHSIQVKADILFEAGNGFKDGTALVLPGGMPGTRNLETYAPLIKLISEYYRSGKHLGAICAAPLILGKMRLLRNEEATCYPGFEDDLEDAILSKKDVVVSGKIITGKGLGVAVEFALKLVEVFKDKDTANQLAKTIVVPE